MSFSDKVSWVGGMLGLFTGFSVISGIEVLYWLWFKVIFHKHDAVVTPSQNDLNKKVDDLETKNDSQIKELKVKSVFNISLFHYILLTSSCKAPSAAKARAVVRSEQVIELNLRDLNPRSAHMNFTRQCALRHN